MSEQTNEAANGSPDGLGQRFGRVRGWGPVAVLFVALIAAASGAFATKAVSHGYGHWHGGGFMHGPLDPADAEKHAERMAKHIAVEADATGEQQEKLVGIARTLAKELVPLRDEITAARQKGRELLTQAVIDRDRIEMFRTEQLALADTITRHITKALADAADALTAEQRKALAERFPPRTGFWRDRDHR